MKNINEIYAEAEDHDMIYVNVLERYYIELYTNYKNIEKVYGELNENLKKEIDYLKEVIGQLITKKYKEEKENGK